MTFIISRSIEVDVGHRVPTHGSKCANLHGHRYKVIAEVTSTSLHREGEQSAMVMDFGFLKDVLVKHVDVLADHGMILWCDDPWAALMMDPYGGTASQTLVILTNVREKRYTEGYWRHLVERGEDPLSPRKLLIVPFIPTAENLAEFWYSQMKPDIRRLSQHLATLHRVIVWETPNCSASYPV